MEHANPANRLFWKNLGIRCLFVISVLFSHELTAQETTPLHRAASANDLAAVKQLIDQGAQIDAQTKDGWTPLSYAAAFSSTPEIVQLLLDNKAQIDARTKLGSTPLMLAAATSSTPEIVQLLIDKKAQINVRDKLGVTPLMLAAARSSTLEIVQLLIDNKAQIDARDNDCLLYTSPSPRDRQKSRMPSSA